MSECFDSTSWDNQVYLHNHIAHHELTLWACGATPDQLRRHYERNALYMRNATIIVDPLVLDFEDDAIFARCLGKEEHYRNFEMFFLNTFKKIGWQAGLQKYLLDGSPLADDMMYRIYMGKNSHEDLDRILILSSANSH